MATSQNFTRAVPWSSKKFGLQIKDGADFYRLPGVAQLDGSGGEGTPEQDVTLDETYQDTETPGVPTIDGTVPAAQFFARATMLLANAYLNHTRLTGRLISAVQPTAIVDDSTAKVWIKNADGVFVISPAGGVDLENGPVDSRQGYGIKVGNAYYMIDEITGPTGGKVYPYPEADVGTNAAGVAFTIGKPRIQSQEFVFGVSSCYPGNFTTSGPHLGFNFTIAPVSPLKLFTAVA